MAVYRWVWGPVWITAVAWGQGPDAAQLIADGYYRQAETAARRTLAELDRADPAGTLETARVLDRLGRALIAEAADAATIQAALDRAIAVKTRLLGAEHPAIGVSLGLEAEQRYWQGDYPGAIPLFERALAMAERPPGAAPLEIAAILHAMGTCLSAAGQSKRAQTLHERGLEIRERELGPDSPRVAESLTSLAVSHWQAGDLKGAKERVERAMAILDRTVAEDHPAKAYAEATLAGLLKTERDYPAAIALYERAIAAFEKRLGPEHQRVATQLNNLALCLKLVDRWSEAATALERALGIFEMKYGPDHPRTGIALANLGIVYKEMGDFTRARAAYERALAVEEKRLGPDHEYTGSAVFSVGMLLTDMRDYAAAKPYLMRAMAIHEKALGPDSPHTLEDMNGLAHMLELSGDVAGATALYRKVAERTERTLGPKNAQVGLSLINLGEMAERTKDHAEARRMFTRALDICQSAFGPEHHHTAEAVAHLGQVEAAEGKWEAAAEYHARAVATFTKVYGGRNYAMAGAVAALAEDLAHLGRREEALGHALEAAEIWRDHVRLTIRGLPERQALLIAAEANSGLDVAVSLAVEGLPERRLGEVWDAVMRNRALVLDELAARRRAVSASARPEVARLTAELGTARERLARLVVQGPGAGADRAYAARVEGERKQVEVAERSLAAQAIEFRRELDARRQGYAEVAAALPAGSALVAYARYRRRALGAKGGSEAESYAALILRAGAAGPAMAPLGTASGIERLVENWRREIRREAESMGRNAQWNEREYRRAGAALRAAVWDPVTAHLGGARSVYVVPDGALMLVNLGTLPIGEKRYLAEQGPLLHELSAERDLADARGPEHGRGLLAVGNPAFDAAGTMARANGAVFRGARSQCADFASLHFDPLPGSAVEVRAIAGIWGGQKEGATVLSGRDATEAELKKDAAGKRVVHLATHGFFLAQWCRGDAAVEESPLLRAGLALAGANRRKSAGKTDEDGILTAEEVASLELAGVEWVVLSGCDTGEGEVRAGEGVLGLRRAFRTAGAGTLIASLWPVEDEAARAWMTALYRARFVRGVGTAEAVADATVSELRARRARGVSTHPFYWGGFVAVGD